MNPGAPPNIRPKSTFSHKNSNRKIVVTTTASYSDEEKEDFVRIRPNTQKPPIALPSTKNPATAADINYAFTFHPEKYQKNTELPHNYQYHHSNIPGLHHGQFRDQFRTSTYRAELVSSTRKNQPTTFRSYVSSLKTPPYRGLYGTEKPERLQLPLPLLPTLPPLMFSSPAPFSLRNHIETKRYTNEHQTPPRIIISASASVSDNSGRRLNYSLGTIGVTPVLDEPTKNYDDYKDHDVVLDPFYHDVPKIKGKRRKRQINYSEVIKTEEEAADVLKFLFEWYKNHNKNQTISAPFSPNIITEINDELAPVTEIDYSEDNIDEKLVARELNYKASKRYVPKNEFNIVGDVFSATEQNINKEVLTPPQSEEEINYDDYVDDNYEAQNQNNEDDKAAFITKNSTPVTELIDFDQLETTPTITTTTLKPKNTWTRGKNRLPTRPKNNLAFNKQQQKYLSTFRSPNSKLKTQRSSSTEMRNETSLMQTLKPVDEEVEVDTSTTLIDTTTTDINNEIETTTLYSAETYTTEETENQTILEFTTITTTETPYTTITIPEIEEVTENLTTFERDNKNEESSIITQSSEITESTTPNITTIKYSENNTSNKKKTVENSFAQNIQAEAYNIGTTLKSNSNVENFPSDVDDINTILYKTVEMENDKTTEIEVNFTTEIPISSVSIPLVHSFPKSITRNSENYTTEFTKTTIEDMEELEVENITPVETTTIPIGIRAKNKKSYRKTKARNRLSNDISLKPSLKNSPIDQKIVDVANNQITTAEFTTSTQYDEVLSTDAPLLKSANPTQSEAAKAALHTTPLSMIYKLHVRKEKIRPYIFNCFEKPLNHFYLDPRDCRLFHYCTSGYTKNQLLDMKFVCDLGTYFDDQKLMCTKTKPKRCL